MTETTRVAPMEPSAVAAETVVRDQLRLSWGAIFGGAISAFGLWLLLYVFGLAIGLTTLDANNPNSLRPSGMFTGIWALVSPLIALFVGGWVAGRGAGFVDRPGGGIHGLVVWALATLIGATLIASLMSAVVSGVASVGKAVAGAGSDAIGAAAGQSGKVTGVAQQLGISTNDLLGPVNDRLRAEGKPTVTADQLQAATRDVAQSAVTTGRIDQDMLVQALVANTALTRADAQDVADQVETQYQQKTAAAKDRLNSAAATAETGALKAAETSGKALWGAFGALLLGLVASVLGGSVGAGGGHRALRRRQRVVAQRTPVAPPREVYP